MSLLSRFQIIDDGTKRRAVRELVEEATPDFDYFLMLILSAMMATFGLLAGNETIVIGAMLLAPLLAPVMSLALGTSMSHHPLITRSLSTILWSVAFAVGAAIVGAFLFSVGNLGGSVNEVILSRTEPSLLFFIVAVISGFAVAYASVRPKLSARLPGVAIAVALIPPLGVLGIGIAALDASIVAGSALMFLVNIAGIVFASMVTFSLMDVHHTRYIAENTIKKEEKRLEEEHAEIAKIEKNDTQEDRSSPRIKNE